MLVTPPSDPEAALKVFLNTMVSPAWAAAHPEFIAKMLRQPPLPAYAQRLHYQASEGHDAWDLLPIISTPTLVIHGSNDLINPTANAYLLAERIPNTELYIVEGGRHGYMIEFCEEANHVVKEFLARHPLNELS